MIQIQPMTESSFDEFKVFSQNIFAEDLANAQSVTSAEALKNAAEQFDRLVPNGLRTPCQLFFDAVEKSTGKPVGYLWLGIKENSNRKIMSINDIFVNENFRGRGYGKMLMNFVDLEAKKTGAVRIRLHVFANNRTARNLYETSGFETSSLDMYKVVT